MKFSELMKKWHKRFVEDEDEKTRFSHSTSYHTFFQGYSEQKVLAENAAGYRIEREYTAHYLAFTDDRRKWIGHKVLYSILYLGSAALTLLAQFSRAYANYTAWVSVFGALQAVALLLLLIPVLYYVTAPMKMKMGRFNISAKRMSFLSKPAAALAALYFLTGAVWYLIYRVTPGERDVLCLVSQFFSAAAITALCIIENRTKYRRIENEAADPSREANEIW